MPHSKQALKKQIQKTHTTCRRCGRTSFHIQKKVCSACGYPSARNRHYQWGKKMIRRKNRGTGRMRYEKDLPRRFKNGFREKVRSTLLPAPSLPLPRQAGTSPRACRRCSGARTHTCRRQAAVGSAPFASARPPVFASAPPSDFPRPSSRVRRRRRRARRRRPPHKRAMPDAETGRAFRWRGGLSVHNHLLLGHLRSRRAPFFVGAWAGGLRRATVDGPRRGWVYTSCGGASPRYHHELRLAVALG